MYGSMSHIGSTIKKKKCSTHWPGQKSYSRADLTNIKLHRYLNLQFIFKCFFPQLPSSIKTIFRPYRSQFGLRQILSGQLRSINSFSLFHSSVLTHFPRVSRSTTVAVVTRYPYTSHRHVTPFVSLLVLCQFTLLRLFHEDFKLVNSV